MGNLLNKRGSVESQLLRNVVKYLINFGLCKEFHRLVMGPSSGFLQMAVTKGTIHILHNQKFVFFVPHPPRP